MLKHDKPSSESGRRAAPDTAQAESIATEALAFIACDERLLNRFLDLTGLEVASLRVAAADPGFLPGVLDFVLSHEPTLEAFSADREIAPEAVASARRRLGPAPSESEVWG